MTAGNQRAEAIAANVARIFRRGAYLMTALAILASLAMFTAMTRDNAEGDAPSPADERHHAFEPADPGPSPTLGMKPPIDDEHTVVLFDGGSWTNHWATRDGAPSGWEVLDTGAVRITPGAGDARTTDEYRDFQLHLEFRCPLMPDAAGQARANSGVYLHGRYEVQVLDSFGLDPKDNDCGAIYRVSKPLVNACRPPGEWQTYDIVFRAPRFDDAGEVVENPRITVWQNGACIQNNVEVPHPTGAAMFNTMTTRGPIVLQDHGNPVEYRNIWLRTLDRAE